MTMDDKVRVTRIEPGVYDTVNAHGSDGQPYRIENLATVHPTMTGWRVYNQRGHQVSDHATLGDAKGSLVPDDALGVRTEIEMFVQLQKDAGHWSEAHARDI